VTAEGWGDSFLKAGFHWSIAEHLHEGERLRRREAAAG
jgi:hypothetical protein